MEDGKRFTPDERRHHILDVAHQAFIRDGYAGASMSRIAAEVGGSKTTLYNYFDSKKELFVAVAERETARLLDAAFAAETTESAGFAERIAAMARRMMAAMLTDEMVESYRLIVAESGRFPEIGLTAFDMAVERAVARLASAFEQAMGEGFLRRCDAKAAAELFITLTSGMLRDKRVWNVVKEVTPAMIAREAERAATAFLAMYGNDVLSAAARR